jgi:hypothetical protein
MTKLKARLARFAVIAAPLVFALAAAAPRVFF